jgi:hypothetical protein
VCAQNKFILTLTRKILPSSGINADELSGRINLIQGVLDTSKARQKGVRVKLIYLDDGVENNSLKWEPGGDIAVDMPKT